MEAVELENTLKGLDPLVFDEPGEVWLVLLTKLTEETKLLKNHRIDDVPDGIITDTHELPKSIGARMLKHLKCSFIAPIEKEIAKLFWRKREHGHIVKQR